MSDAAAALKLVIVSRRVHPAHGPGGLERHVHDQALHLARAGVQVDLYAERPLDPTRASLAEEEAGSGIRFHWIDRGPLPIGRARGTVVLDRLTNYPLWSRRVARSLDPVADVIHVHGLGGLGIAAQRARHAPLVMTPHGMEEFRSPGWLKHLAYAPFRRGIRRIAAAADRVVATDEILSPRVEHELRVPAHRITVIPNAIDPEECTRCADRSAASTFLQRAGATEAAPLFVSVGRLAPNKGFEVLAQALGRAAADLPVGWCWVLIGDGPQRGRIEAAIAGAGIGGHCMLLTSAPDALKHGLLAAADWFVHPTLYEGSSLATLEAMAHGLPVIASRAGGLPDKVVDGGTGLLVAPGDSRELASALLRTLRSDAVALGTAGRRLLEERFSWAAVLPLYLQLYAELAPNTTPVSGSRRRP